MLQQIVFNVTLYSILFKIDQELTEIARAACCPYCGGPLHCGYYIRKPRGGPDNLPEEYSIRMGLCCGHCRRRTLPPSSLFLGRKQHWGAIVLVVTMFGQKRTEGYTISRLMDMFCVSYPTLVRWRRYFQEEYAASSRWKECRSRVGLRVRSDDLPGALVEYFVHVKADEQEGLVACLCFLACGRVSPKVQAC
jgi:hypothetical protein